MRRLLAFATKSARRLYVGHEVWTGHHRDRAEPARL